MHIFIKNGYEISVPNNLEIDGSESFRSKKLSKVLHTSCSERKDSKEIEFNCSYFENYLFLTEWTLSLCARCALHILNSIFRIAR